MTMTFTPIDDTYSANESSGRKHIFGTVSCTNPYTASGDTFSTATYFKAKFLGGVLTMVNPSMTANQIGRVRTATFRGDTSSFAAAVVQLLDVGLSGTANAGLFVDNTTANISSHTYSCVLFGY